MLNNFKDILEQEKNIYENKKKLEQRNDIKRMNELWSPLA